MNAVLILIGITASILCAGYIWKSIITILGGKYQQNVSVVNKITNTNASLQELKNENEFLREELERKRNYR